MSARHAPQAGQATVELIALIPAIVVVVAVVWQVVLAGHAVWASTAAARAAARAHALGNDARATARARLPDALASGARVSVRDDGDVAVEVRIPSVLGLLQLGTVTGRAHFEPQR